MLDELDEPGLTTKEWIVIALICIVLLPIAIPVIGVSYILEKLGLIHDGTTN